MLEKNDIAKNLSPEKEERLHQSYKNLEKYGDGIEPKIKDTIAYLNALGFNTCESCEGHVDHGDLSTYIGMKEPEPPKWRFVGEKEVLENAAKFHGVTVPEIMEYCRPKYEISDENFIRPESEEDIITAYEEAWEETQKKEETEEFTLWRKKTDEMKEKLNTLVREFYKNRNVPYDVRLKLDTDNHPEYRSAYQFFLHNGGEDYEKHCDPDERKKLSSDEMNVLKKRLDSRQKEMKDFTEFLKEKYNS